MEWERLCLKRESDVMGGELADGWMAVGGAVCVSLVGSVVIDADDVGSVCGSQVARRG